VIAAGSEASSPFRVALTIDAEFADRPTDAGTTARLLDVLAEDGIPAAVFVQGRWASGEPSLARRVAEEGHLVGNHSHHHARMTLLTGPGIVRDVLEAEQAIVDVTGVNPTPWFRCPFGAGARSKRVIRRLAVAGYRDVSWHVDSLDWEGAAARTLERRIVRGTLTHGDGAVILVHGWPAATPAAVRASVARLRDEGATFVRLDALPEIPGLQLPAGDAA
jgi:peptidoglycan/xylan/chitin deacetylase (PgdA/CDA1 family)